MDFLLFWTIKDIRGFWPDTELSQITVSAKWPSAKWEQLTFLSRSDTNTLNKVMQMNPLRLRTRSYFEHMWIKNMVGLHKKKKSFYQLFWRVIWSFTWNTVVWLLLILFHAWIISNDHWMLLNILNQSLLPNEWFSSRLWVENELTPILDIRLLSLTSILDYVIMWLFSLPQPKWVLK